LFVVFVYAFPAFREDGRSEGMSTSDSRDFEIEIAEGEVEISGVEAVSGIFGMILEEKFSFFEHNGVDKGFKELREYGLSSFALGLPKVSNDFFKPFV